MPARVRMRVAGGEARGRFTPTTPTGGVGYRGGSAIWGAAAGLGWAAEKRSTSAAPCSLPAVSWVRAGRNGMVEGFGTPTTHCIARLAFLHLVMIAKPVLGACKLGAGPCRAAGLRLSNNVYLRLLLR